MESIEDVLSEMTKLKSKLPPRPTPDELKYATQTIDRVESTLTSRLEDLFHQTSPTGVPYHVFRAYLEMREEIIRAKADEEKRMAVSIIELEERHQKYDALIAKVQNAVIHPLHNNAVHEGSAYDYKQPVLSATDSSKHSSLPSLSEDNSYSGPLSRNLSAGNSGERSFKKSTINSSRISTPVAPYPGSQPDQDNGEDGAKHYSPKVLSAINNAKIHSLKELKLNDMGVEWIPELIGNLTHLTSLDLSGNRLTALPESIGELSNLQYLNVSKNALKTLPETIGCLTSLRHLDIQMNKIEELPMTIGLCTQLVELLCDFNELKVLPEATGNLVSLQKLRLYMNHVHRLPTTLRSLTNLVELDVKFNRLERVPESVCYLPNLIKLDVSSNFVELKELPGAIGQMQSLRELNISNNHISLLPPSFAMLTGLEKLEMDQNPWVIPPLDVVQRGKEAVFQFMADLVSQEAKDEKETIKKTGFGRLSSVFRKKKTQGSPYKVKKKNDLLIRA